MAKVDLSSDFEFWFKVYTRTTSSLPILLTFPSECNEWSAHTTLVYDHEVNTVITSFQISRLVCAGSSPQRRLHSNSAGARKGRSAVKSRRRLSSHSDSRCVSNSDRRLRCAAGARVLGLGGVAGVAGRHSRGLA